MNEEARFHAQCLVALHLKKHRLWNGEAEQSKDGPVVLDIQLMGAALVILEACVERRVVALLG